MGTTLNPYIQLQDGAREAVTFYQGVFGGTVTLSTFGEYGAEGPGADRVMHAQVVTDDGLTLMVSDTPEGDAVASGSNIAVSLSGDDSAALHGYWDKLSDGGTVMVPLEKQMWGDEFGMCADRFGVGWMVNITASSG